MSPRFTISGHAVDQFIARVVPHYIGPTGWAGARALLVALSRDCVRVPVPPGASHQAFRTHDPIAILVAVPNEHGVADDPDDLAVVTVLGPNDAYVPTVRSHVAVTRDEQRGPSFVRRARKPAFTHVKRRPQNVVNVEEREVAAALEDAALRGPTPLQAEAAALRSGRPVCYDVTADGGVVAPGAPTVASALSGAPTAPPTPMTPEQRRKRGEMRARVLDDYRRLADGAAAVAAMVLDGAWRTDGEGVTLADAESAVTALGLQEALIESVFAGKPKSIDPARATLLAARNRLAALKVRMGKLASHGGVVVDGAEYV